MGVHRAGVLLTTGSLVPAEQAVQIGLVDELAEGDLVCGTRDLPGCRTSAQQPRQPMLLTRAIARADLHVALQPDLIQLDRSSRLVRPGCAERPAGPGSPAGQIAVAPPGVRSLSPGRKDLTP